MKHFLAVLVFFVFSNNLLAGDSIPEGDGKLHIGGSFQFGYLWAHRYTMGNLVKSHIPAGELDIFRNTDGYQPWEKHYYYPQIGLAFVSIALGNPDQLGNAFGFYPYINFPLGNHERKFKWHMRYGWGIGYLTKKFDPLENHQNVAIGSHFNTCFTLRLNGNWNLNERNMMEFGIGITHFSNGALIIPNLGLNIPMLSIGYYYELSRQPNHQLNDAGAYPHWNKTMEILTDRAWHFSPFLVFGLNDTDPAKSKEFGVGNVLLNVTKQTGPKTRWLAGVDIMCSAGIRDRLEKNGIHVSQAGAMQYGVKAGYEMVMGRISLPVEFGVYLHTLYKDFGPVYDRFGVRYLLSDHFIACLNLKTHLARAEYWEVGFAYRI